MTAISGLLAKLVPRMPASDDPTAAIDGKADTGSGEGAFAAILERLGKPVADKGGDAKNAQPADVDPRSGAAKDKPGKDTLQAHRRALDMKAVAGPAEGTALADVPIEAKATPDEPSPPAGKKVSEHPADAHDAAKKKDSQSAKQIADASETGAAAAPQLAIAAASQAMPQSIDAKAAKHPGREATSQPSTTGASAVAGVDDGATPNAEAKAVPKITVVARETHFAPTKREAKAAALDPATKASSNDRQTTMPGRAMTSSSGPGPSEGARTPDSTAAVVAREAPAGQVKSDADSSTPPNPVAVDARISANNDRGDHHDARRDASDRAPETPHMASVGANGAGASANVAASSGSTSLPPQTLHHVADAIVSEAASVASQPTVVPGDGGGSGPLRVLSLRLDPPEYGSVSVHMRLTGNDLSLRFSAGREETAHLLREDQDKLIGLLRASGYDVHVTAIDQRSDAVAAASAHAAPAHLTHAGAADATQAPAGQGGSGPFGGGAGGAGADGRQQSSQHQPGPRSREDTANSYPDSDRRHAPTTDDRPSGSLYV